jgi:hypothetical protein
MTDPFSKFPTQKHFVYLILTSNSITSYINNLHPQRYRDLYKVVEDIISKAIPLWNMTLTPLKTHYTTPIFKGSPTGEMVKTEYLRFERIKVKCIEYDEDQDLLSHPDRPQEEDDVDSDEDEYEDRLWEWELATRRVLQPDARKFHPPTVPDTYRDEFFQPGTDILKPEKSVDLKRDYGERGLQVIVKLANIELTPSKPEYEGGTCMTFNFFRLVVLVFGEECCLLTYNRACRRTTERTHLRHSSVLLLQRKYYRISPRLPPTIFQRLRNRHFIRAEHRFLAGAVVRLQELRISDPGSRIGPLPRRTPCHFSQYPTAPRGTFQTA